MGMNLQLSLDVRDKQVFEDAIRIYISENQYSCNYIKYYYLSDSCSKNDVLVIIQIPEIEILFKIGVLFGEMKSANVPDDKKAIHHSFISKILTVFIMLLSLFILSFCSLFYVLCLW